MRWRPLGLLASLLAVMALVYYGLEAREKKSSDAKQLFRIDEKEIDKLSLKNGQEQLVVEREGSGWRLVEPVQAKANAMEISSALQALLTAKQERTIDERPKSLAEYGLEQPAIQLTLTPKGGKPPVVLMLGEKNPSGFSVYAKWGDQPSVFLVADTLRTRFDRKAADFRDKTLLALEPDKVKQLELVSKGRSMSLSSSGGDTWELTQPIKAKADASAIRQLLWSIKDGRVKDFLPAEADAKRHYGLDRPDLAVAIIQADGPKRLLLRKAQDPKVGLYAMAEPGDGVVTVDARLLTALSKSPFDLRDRSLFRFETADIKAVEFRRGAQSIKLAKEGDAWKLTAPTQAVAQAAKVYDLLYALKELRFIDLVEENGGDLARYGLKAPQVEVTVSTNEGSRLPALLLGKSEKNRLYAKLSTAATIYAIDPKFLDRLPSGPDALKQEAKPAAGK